MGTRSRIGIVNKNNTITSIYCHWDGYPEYNGKLLLLNYTERKDVEALMSLGSLSTLGRKPVAPASELIDKDMLSYKQDEYDRIRAENEANGTIGNPCCIPHSVRGDGNPAETHSRDKFPSGWEEWEYLYSKGGKWYYRRVGNKKFYPLTMKRVTKK